MLSIGSCGAYSRYCSRLLFKFRSSRIPHRCYMTIWSICAIGDAVRHSRHANIVTLRSKIPLFPPPHAVFSTLPCNGGWLCGRVGGWVVGWVVGRVVGWLVPWQGGWVGGWLGGGVTTVKVESNMVKSRVTDIVARGQVSGSDR